MVVHLQSSMHSFIEVQTLELSIWQTYISYLWNIPDRGYFHCLGSGHCRDIRSKIDSEKIIIFFHHALSRNPSDFYEWSSGNIPILNEGYSVVIPRASKLQGQIHPRRSNSCSFAPGTRSITLTSLPAPGGFKIFNIFQLKEWVALVFETCENELLIIEVWSMDVLERRWAEPQSHVITPTCSERFWEFCYRVKP